MKILFISEHSHHSIGGIANHITNIGKILEIQGHEIIYVNAENLHGKQLFRKKLIAPAVIKAKLKSVSPDVIHVHGFSSFFINLCLSVAKKTLPNSKLVYTPHYHPFTYHTHPLLAALFFHAFLKKNLKQIDNLIALTQTEQAFFEQYVDRDIIKIIPNGINIHVDIKAKNKPKNNNLLFVGRDDHNKHLDFVLAQRDYFIEHQISCDIVTNTDNVSDDVFTFYKNLSQLQLKELYKKSTLIVIPSKYEAFSIVALEAISCGTPVLISDRVQIKSYFDDNGIFNKVFRYDDKMDFMKKMEMILNMDSIQYEELSKKNIQLAKTFDWSFIVEKNVSVYNGKEFK